MSGSNPAIVSKLIYISAIILRSLCATHNFMLPVTVYVSTVTRLTRQLHPKTR
jgi:hypothetical protein